MIALIQRV
ncbi:MAG: hypothetical protein KDF24_12865, partial [Rhodocyclaceae bacterium]|nr:hypothetical protein [Rhodocyclaceae bacterium]